MVALFQEVNLDKISLHFLRFNGDLEILNEVPHLRKYGICKIPN